MAIKKFEDIIAWRKSGELTVLVHNNFKNLNDYSFKSQIQRASVSIMNNIAEGFERNTNKEFKKVSGISSATLYRYLETSNKAKSDNMYPSNNAILT